MKAMIQNFFRNEEGASAVEYGLLVALIAAGLVTVLGTLGTNLQGKFTTVSDAVK